MPRLALTEALALPSLTAPTAACPTAQGTVFLYAACARASPWLWLTPYAGHRAAEAVDAFIASGWNTAEVRSSRFEHVEVLGEHLLPPGTLQRCDPTYSSTYVGLLVSGSASAAGWGTAHRCARLSGEAAGCVRCLCLYQFDPRCLPACSLTHCSHTSPTHSPTLLTNPPVALCIPSALPAARGEHL